MEKNCAWLHVNENKTCILKKMLVPLQAEDDWCWRLQNGFSGLMHNLSSHLFRSFFFHSINKRKQASVVILWFDCDRVCACDFHLLSLRIYTHAVFTDNPIPSKWLYILSIAVTAATKQSWQIHATMYDNNMCRNKNAAHFNRNYVACKKRKKEDKEMEQVTSSRKIIHLVPMAHTHTHRFVPKHKKAL